MSNWNLKRMKDIECECLKHHRHDLEKNVNCTQVVSMLVNSQALRKSDRRHIIDNTQNPEEQNRRLINMLLEEGTSQQFQLYVAILKHLGYDKQHQLLCKFLRRNQINVAVVPTPVHHGETSEDTLKAILHKVNEIHTMQQADHELLSRLQSMEKEVNDFSQRIEAIEEEMSEIKQFIDQLQNDDSKGRVTSQDVDNIQKALKAVHIRLTTLEEESADRHASSTKEREEREQKVKEVRSKLARVSRRLDQVQQRLEERLDRVDAHVRSVDLKHDRRQQQLETQVKTLRRQNRQISSRLQVLENQQFQRDRQGGPPSAPASSLPDPPLHATYPRYSPLSPIAKGSRRPLPMPRGKRPT